MSRIGGVGLTAFGRMEGRSTLDLMDRAAQTALEDAGLERRDIDGLICGYSTTMPHLMLATVFAERFGISPHYAHAVQLGGATGFAMVMLAHLLADAGAARHILVVAGENRLTGQSRDAAIQTLAQVGHPDGEVPLGLTIPGYYGLLASRYLHDRGAREEDLAELAVLMRRNAGRHPGAQFRDPIGVADVMASKPIADPLKLLDCCPVSDGAAAVIVSAECTDVAGAGRPIVRIRGGGQAHQHQHVSAVRDFTRFGAAQALARAEAAAGLSVADVRYAAVYDSFTVTLAILLEELGLAPPGRAGALARDGHFDRDGALPLNTHGGLLSYGHCGVGGAMAHLVEAHQQMTGRAADRQMREPPPIALLHGDGGVLSSHVSLFLERVR